MEYRTLWFTILLLTQIPSHSAISTYDANQQHAYRRHIDSTYTNYWETGLKESTFRTFLRKGYADPSLKDQIINAPFLSRHNRQATPFGDIAVLARGQLYFSAGGFLFVQDENLYDCDECDETRQSRQNHGQIVALWTVKRLRHHDKSGSHHYETEYLISPTSNNNFLRRNGAFDYDIPGYVFILKNHPSRNENFNNYLQPTPAWYNEEATRYLNSKLSNRYLPPDTTTTGYYYTTPKTYYRNNNRHYHDPDIIPARNNVEKEIELYKKLLQSLKSTQTTTNSVMPISIPPTSQTMANKYDLFNKGTSKVPLSSTVNFPETTPFRPSPMYTRYSEPDPLYTTTPLTTDKIYFQPPRMTSTKTETITTTKMPYSKPTQMTIMKASIRTTIPSTESTSRSSTTRIMTSSIMQHPLNIITTKLTPKIASTTQTTIEKTTNYLTTLPPSTLSTIQWTITSLSPTTAKEFSQYSTPPPTIAQNPSTTKYTPVSSAEFDIFDIFGKSKESKQENKTEISENSQMLSPKNLPQTTPAYAESSQASSIVLSVFKSTESSTIPSTTDVRDSKNVSEVAITTANVNKPTTTAYLDMATNSPIDNIQQNNKNEISTTFKDEVTTTRRWDEVTTDMAKNYRVASIQQNNKNEISTIFKDEVTTTRRWDETTTEKSANFDNTTPYETVLPIMKTTEAFNLPISISTEESSNKAIGEDIRNMVSNIHQETPNKTEITETQYTKTSTQPTILKETIEKNLIRTTAETTIASDSSKKYKAPTSFRKIKTTPSTNTTPRIRKYKYTKIPKRKSTINKKFSIISSTTSSSIDSSSQELNETSTVPKINSLTNSGGNKTDEFGVTTVREDNATTTMNEYQNTTPMTLYTENIEGVTYKTSIPQISITNPHHPELETTTDEVMIENHTTELVTTISSYRLGNHMTSNQTDDIIKSTTLKHVSTQRVNIATTPNSSEIFDDFFGVFSKGTTSTTEGSVTKKSTKNLNTELENQLFGGKNSVDDFENQPTQIEESTTKLENIPIIIFDNFYEPSTLSTIDDSDDQMTNNGEMTTLSLDGLSPENKISNGSTDSIPFTIDNVAKSSVITISSHSNKAEIEDIIVNQPTSTQTSDLFKSTTLSQLVNHATTQRLNSKMSYGSTESIPFMIDNVARESVITISAYSSETETEATIGNKITSNHTDDRITSTTLSQPINRAPTQRVNMKMSNGNTDSIPFMIDNVAKESVITISSNSSETQTETTTGNKITSDHTDDLITSTTLSQPINRAPTQRVNIKISNSSIDSILATTTAIPITQDTIQNDETTSDCMERNLVEAKDENLEITKIIMIQIFNETKTDKRQSDKNSTDTVKANVSKIDVGNENFFIYKAVIDETEMPPEMKGQEGADLFERLALSIVSHAKSIDYLNKRKQRVRRKKVLKKKTRRKESGDTKN